MLLPSVVCRRQRAVVLLYTRVLSALPIPIAPFPRPYFDSATTYALPALSHAVYHRHRLKGDDGGRTVTSSHACFFTLPRLNVPLFHSFAVSDGTTATWLFLSDVFHFSSCTLAVRINLAGTAACNALMGWRTTCFSPPARQIALYT